MSFRLNVLIECSNLEGARALAAYLLEDTRPLLDEDVDPGFEGLFEAIEIVEYPGDVLVEGNQVLVCWEDNEEVEFESLRPLFRLEGFDLVLGYEFPDYADSEDDDYFWIFRGGELRSVRQSKLPADVDSAVVNKVRMGNQGV